MVKPTEASLAPLILIAAVLVGVLTASLGGDGLRPLVALLGLGVASTTISMLLRRASGAQALFHPLGLPLAYLGLVLLSPLAYISLTNSALGLVTPEMITPRLAAIFFLTFAGVAVGAKAGLIISSPGGVAAARVKYGLMRQMGRLGMLMLLMIRLYTYLSQRGTPYGQAQFDVTFSSTLTTFQNTFALIVVIVLAVGNTQTIGSVLSRIDMVGLGAFIAMTLLTGQRSPLIAPAIFLAWAQHTWVRPVRPKRAVLVLLVGVLIFQSVGEVRGGQQGHSALPSSLSEGVERTIRPLASPALVTAKVLEVVPPHPYYDGSTYVAAIERQLPGPISRALFGYPGDTGSFVLRDLTGDTNQNQGYSFSFPTEAYLNFGILGTFLVPTAVGAVLAVAYRRTSLRPSRARHLLYPIILSSLPLSIRSDALTQLKLVLYPMATMALLFLAFRVGKSESTELWQSTPIRSIDQAEASCTG